jgi:leucyl/phenylalanyl-tRNA--protein transferase
MTAIPWIELHSPLFPSPRTFVQDNPELPQDLIALSDSMDEQLLLAAYRQGIFPWYSEGQPVMWWCTSPRMVLDTRQINISDSLRKKLKQVLKNPAWEIKVDTAFREVITACAQSQRKDQDGTWITEEIIAHYAQLHEQGIAHSVETWFDGTLVGGLYGINLGTMFYGESMFRKITDASKIALAALCAWCAEVHIHLIDCQQQTTHLLSMGAHPIPKDSFLDWIESHIDQPSPLWKWDKSVLCAYNKSS